jgi:hypothetical protein
MTRANLASVALVLVAVFGSTGCCSQYGQARYGYRARLRHVIWVPGAPAAPPMVAPAPPPPPAPPQPAYAAYSGGSQPIVVHAQPGTTIVIVNQPGGGQPTVQYLPGGAYAPRQQAPVAPPAPPVQENPNGWGQEE